MADRDGACLISPLPGATPLKPGSATKPLPGVKLQLVDAEGGVLEGAASGNLCITDSWPGQMRTVYGDHRALLRHLFQAYPGKYFTGDGCRRDDDGYYWITGRVDDVINVSGHRLGTAEIESALVGHHAVAEAAVVGFPHDIKGQGIWAYVTLKLDHEPHDDLKADLVAHVRRRNRTLRQSRCDPVGAGLAENAIRQDHAPDPAQGRGGGDGRAGRHEHPGRPERGGRFGKEPGQIGRSVLGER